MPAGGAGTAQQCPETMLMLRQCNPHRLSDDISSFYDDRVRLVCRNIDTEMGILVILLVALTKKKV